MSLNFSSHVICNEWFMSNSGRGKNWVFSSTELNSFCANVSSQIFPLLRKCRFTEHESLLKLHLHSVWYRLIHDMHQVICACCVCFVERNQVAIIWHISSFYTTFLCFLYSLNWISLIKIDFITNVIRLQLEILGSPDY